MRIVQCNTQGSYRHGACMCTTACLQVAMAVLCNKVCLATTNSEDELRHKINHIMDLASQSHARMESSTGAAAAASSSSRMVSVFEIIQERRINLNRLSIQLEELFLTTASSSSPCEMVPSSSGKKGTIPVMKYRATSCFIQPHHIPLCLQTSNPEEASAAATATSNDHTVCLIFHRGSYAFFDPLPGTLALDLTDQQLVDCLCKALRLQQHLLVHPSSSSVSYRRGRKIKKSEEEQQEDEQAARKRMCTTSSKGQEEEHQQQQCDITLLYRHSSKR